jgi:arginine exporter protein ArgO
VLRIRSKVFPLRLSVLGVVPALPWLGGVFSVFSDTDSTAGWLFYIGGILFAWLWYVALGVVLLRQKSLRVSPVAVR